MENNERKISTSIQYQLSNNLLFNEVFGNWPNFNNILNKGPNEMKRYLFENWNKVKTILGKDNNLIIKDFDKKVSIDDFNVTHNVTVKGTHVFFIIFPDYDYNDAASKYVALVLAPNRPRYYTLEYSESIINPNPCWVVGEFVIKNGKKVHVNHGTTDNMRLTWFAGYIMGMLDAENI